MKTTLLLITAFLMSSSLVVLSQTNDFSLQFDGLNDYVLTSTPGIAGSNARTISFVAKLDAGVTEGVAFSYGGTSDFGGGPDAFLVFLNPDWGGVPIIELNVDLHNRVYQLNTPPQNSLNYYSIVFPLATGNILSNVLVYQNGVLLNPIGGVDGTVETALENPVNIGRSYRNSQYFKGIIDDVEFWDIALSLSQIDNYMDCPPVGTETGLIGFWNFEEGAGTVTQDQTVFNNDGALTNGVVWSNTVLAYFVPTITIGAGGATTFCSGGAVTLTATHNGTSLQWKKNGVNIAGAVGVNYTATTSGAYSCQTLSFCGNTTSTDIVVTVNKKPFATISAGGATTFCAGGSVLLTANAGGGLSYQWYKGASPIAGATSISYTATTTGNYKCRVTKTATGCFKDSNKILVTVSCREESTQTKIHISPNPTPGIVNLSFENSLNPGEIIVSAVDGRILTKTPFENTLQNIQIDLSSYPPGLYNISVVDLDGQNTYQVIKVD